MKLRLLSASNTPGHTGRPKKPCVASSSELTSEAQAGVFMHHSVKLRQVGAFWEQHRQHFLGGREVFRPDTQRGVPREEGPDPLIVLVGAVAQGAHDHDGLVGQALGPPGLPEDSVLFAPSHPWAML